MYSILARNAQNRFGLNPEPHAWQSSALTTTGHQLSITIVSTGLGYTLKKSSLTASRFLPKCPLTQFLDPPQKFQYLSPTKLYTYSRLWTSTLCCLGPRSNLTMMMIIRPLS